MERQTRVLNERGKRREHRETEKTGRRLSSPVLTGSQQPRRWPRPLLLSPESGGRSDSLLCCQQGNHSITLHTASLALPERGVASLPGGPGGHAAAVLRTAPWPLLRLRMPSSALCPPEPFRHRHMPTSSSPLLSQQLGPTHLVFNYS